MMAQLLNSSFTPTSPCLRRQSMPSLTQPTSRKPQIQAKIREIFMPTLSSTMTEGKIVSWVKSEGDKLSKGEGKRIVASPYAKKLAKELNIDLSGVVGSGPMGRIVAKDVEVAVVARAVAGAAVAEPTKPPAMAPGIELGSVVPFTTMQGAVGRNMVESLGVPTFRVGYTITTNALDALYKKQMKGHIRMLQLQLQLSQSGGALGIRIARG
ncbi:hypothetical protein L6452_06663 [Arctium lappa]|uniref:Uncharacterized protein n=1 Tax=Arctium lappa TaxID=4217 RepID=A0ACB9EKG0_ARCLA|nr:hypothetical protein L6452_06663 [Arctium lappa]